MYLPYDVLVNRRFLLPADYIPGDMTAPCIPFDADENDPKRLLRCRAAYAAEELFRAAEADGYHLYGVSGFRSYQRQEELYQNSLARRGPEHTEKYLAPPGGSEHQTALALDVSVSALDFDLITEFEDTPEARWLHRRASCFGFILRYPKGREEITGYAYEPWHIRFVTKPLAVYLTENQLTLEEYYIKFS